MLIEQSEAISTNISKIARLKTRSGMVTNPDEYAPVSTEFNEVFGGEHPNVSWHWFIPLKVEFPHWAIDNIMGYDVSAAAMTLDCSTPYQEPESEMMEGEDIPASSSSSLVAGVALPSLGREQGSVFSRNDSVGIGERQQFGLVEDDTDIETVNVDLNPEQNSTTTTTTTTTVRQKQMLEQKLLPRKDDATTLASDVRKRSAGSFIL